MLNILENERIRAAIIELEKYLYKSRRMSLYA